MDKTTGFPGGLFDSGYSESYSSIWYLKKHGSHQYEIMKILRYP